MLSYVPESYNSGMVTEFKGKQDFKKGQDREQRFFLNILFSTFFPLINSCLNVSLYFEYKIGAVTWTVVLRLAVKK